MRWTATAALLFGFATASVPAAEPTLAKVTVPLASTSAVEQRIGASLRLRVENYGESIEIEVLSARPIADCFENLARRWPHGPDPSEVMPWQVAERYFEEPRLIAVCGHRLEVEARLVAPRISADGERFVSGSLVVTVRRSRRVSSASR